jgi:hypothetical protein
VGFLGLVQLVIVPAAGVLAVIELVKGIPQDRGDLVPTRIEPVELSLHHVELRVGPMRWRYLLARHLQD